MKKFEYFVSGLGKITGLVLNEDEFEQLCKKLVGIGKPAGKIAKEVRAYGFLPPIRNRQIPKQAFSLDITTDYFTACVEGWNPNGPSKEADALLDTALTNLPTKQKTILEEASARIVEHIEDTDQVIATLLQLGQTFKLDRTARFLQIDETMNLLRQHMTFAGLLQGDSHAGLKERIHRALIAYVILDNPEEK